MPEIARFYGIKITIYFDEHPPSHFHAQYGEFEAVFSIDAGKIIQGALPNTAKKLVSKWYSIHKEEIHAVWVKIQNEESFNKIAPLE